MRYLTVLAALVLFAVTAESLSAQIPPTRGSSQQQQQRRPEPEDTIPVPQFRFRPPVSPLGAVGLSMLVPGWGQAVMGRRGTGAFFVFWEGLTLTMTIKAARQLNYQESTNAETVEGKREEFQDWLVLLVFNHIVAGAEAYVSAQLWDFPAELEARTLPGGAAGFGVNIYLGDLLGES